MMARPLVRDLGVASQVAGTDSQKITIAENEDKDALTLKLIQETDISALAFTRSVSNKKYAGEKELVPQSSDGNVNATDAKALITRPGPTQANTPSVTKRIKPVTPQQQAENEYRKGSQFRQQGMVDEAIMAFDAALKFDSSHQLARQSLVAVLLENRRNAEAELVLQTALSESLKRTDEAMWLARMQVENKQVASALETLQKSLPYAGQRPDYLAFIAAVYQRQEQHKQAISSYRQALQLSSANGAWWMGMAISLQAEKRDDEARAAYKRALTAGTLSSELQAYVNSRLQEIP
jgi:MSHA biogenesis protein MshN